MANYLVQSLVASWSLLMSAGIYFVLGLLVAGLLQSFVPTTRIARHFGGRTLRSVLAAAIAGIPLPLCSCGVLPAAIGLRQQGASKGATLAFLISTPESGIDSIAVTYALLDPVMTVLRPTAAFLTAFVAGAGELFFGTDAIVPPRATPCPSCHLPLEASGASTAPPTIGFAARLMAGLRYAFTDLLRDITPTFLYGLLLGGAISHLLPDSFVETYLGQGWSAMFTMLLVGIPLYICASASTPIAAALLLKGMSPGAALVFLLAGPATNITSIPVIAKALGWRSVGIYLGAIVLCSLLFGMLTNAIYNLFHIDIRASLTQAHIHGLPESVRLFFAIGLLAAMARVTLASPQGYR